MFETDRFYDWIRSTTGWEIFWEIFGVNFGRPSLWQPLAIADPNHFANWPAEFGKICHGKLWALVTSIFTMLELQTNWKDVQNGTHLAQRLMT